MERLARKLNTNRFLLVLGLSAVALAAGQVPGPAVPEVSNLLSPRAEAQGHEVKEWSLTQGSCTYTLTGKASYVRAGDAVCGIYFEGKGHFHYTSHTPLEFPVARLNLSHYKKSCYGPEPGLIRSTLDEGIFWFAGQAVPELSGATVPVVPAHFDKLLAMVRDKDQSAFALDLGLRALHSTDKPYFRAQITGWKQGFWVHSVDALDSETLSIPAFNQVRTFNYQWVPVSRQPIGWTYPVPKTPRFVLTHVDLDLKASKATEGSLKVAETFLPLQEGIQALDLDLYGFRAGIDLQEHLYRKQIVHLKSVRDAQGNALAFSHVDHRVLVSVPGMKTGTPVVLSFEIDGEIIPENRKETAFWRLDPGRWFPLPEDEAARAFTVHAKVSVPKPYIPYMGGDTILRTEEGENCVLETRLEHPVQAFGITAGKGEFQEETLNGVTIRVVSNNPGMSPARKLLISQTGEAIGIYRSLIGPFPFRELTIVPWGLQAASPGMFSAAPREFSYPGPTLSARSLSERRELLQYNLWLARETAQQYWGQAVQPWSPEDDTLISEAFSDYSMGLVVLNKKELGRKWFDVLPSGWSDDWKLWHGSAAIPLAFKLWPDHPNVEEMLISFHLTQQKPPYLLYSLHQELGDEAFVKFLHSFYQTYLWKHCPANAVATTLKAVTGKDYTPFMDECYWGTGWPSLEKNAGK